MSQQITLNDCQRVKKKWEHKEKFASMHVAALGVLHGSSKPVCVMVGRDMGGDCGPSTISDSK